jgi:DNA-binding IclR family transcriptional regulator
MAVKFLPADGSQVAAARSSLGRVLLATGRAQEAEAHLRHSLPILEKAQGPHASITVRTREALSRVSDR